MPNSWMQALNSYRYEVGLREFSGRNRFPGFFEEYICGDRASTILFEQRFQQTAPDHVEAFFEAIFWKLYSLGNSVREQGTARYVTYLTRNPALAQGLWPAVMNFARHPSVLHCRKIKQCLGITGGGLALPLTLPALADPERIPIVDQNVAQWIAHNHCDQNLNRSVHLVPFPGNQVDERHFLSYLHWVEWCQDSAALLSYQTSTHWRARDVEMAVFQAQRSLQWGDRRIRLNPLSNEGGDIAALQGCDWSAEDREDYVNSLMEMDPPLDDTIYTSSH